MKRIALVGYGKMGKVIESLASEYDAEIVLRLDEFNNVDGAGMTPEAFAGTDVAIEFTAPAVALGHLRRLAELGVPTVCGTTGWYAELPAVKEWFASRGGRFVWAPNFSIGVNLFERLVAEAAASFAAYEEYGAWAWEMHHDQKKDAPSGTLKALVEAMRNAGYTLPVDVSSSRAGKVPGTHVIGFDSAADTIELHHVARNREGFARGALHAARWLSAHDGVHAFSEILFGIGKSTGDQGRSPR
ncbi:MAG: dihydrodipicolinate reductase C-terminal domain-containing protein [Bryobacterales bacterium]|nr:dihydrodipicolinate reductase C-terminal domain-containing protein [Bryobacterales bacterium]